MCGSRLKTNPRLSSTLVAPPGVSDVDDGARYLSSWVMFSGNARLAKALFVFRPKLFVDEEGAVYSSGSEATFPSAWGIPPSNSFRPASSGSESKVKEAAGFSHFWDPTARGFPHSWNPSAGGSPLVVESASSWIGVGRVSASFMATQ